MSNDAAIGRLSPPFTIQPQRKGAKYAKERKENGGIPIQIRGLLHARILFSYFLCALSCPSSATFASTLFWPAIGRLHDQVNALIVGSVGN